MDSDSDQENYESATCGNNENEYFIGGIQPKTPKKAVRDYFAQFGDIRELRLMRDKNTKRFRGFGFISYVSMHEGLVLEAMQHHLAGANIQIKKALSKQTTQSILLGEKDRKVFVNGLDPDTQEPEIFAHFEKYGEIENVKVIKEKGTQKSRGFAFILYKSNEDAGKLLAATDSHVVAGCTLEVHPSIFKEDNKEASTSVTGSMSRDQTESSHVGSHVSNSIQSNGPKKPNPAKVKGLTAVSEDYARRQIALASKRAEKLEKTFNTGNNRQRRQVGEVVHDFSGATYGPSEYSSSSTQSISIGQTQERPDMLLLLARFKRGEIDEAAMLSEIAKLSGKPAEAHTRDMRPPGFPPQPYYPPYYPAGYPQEPAGYPGYPYYPAYPPQPFNQPAGYPPHFGYPGVFPRQSGGPADLHAPQQCPSPAYPQQDNRLKPQQLMHADVAPPANSYLGYPPQTSQQPKPYPFAPDHRFERGMYPHAGPQPQHTGLQNNLPRRSSPEDTLNFSNNKTFQVNSRPSFPMRTFETSNSQEAKHAPLDLVEDNEAYDGDSILESSIFDLKSSLEQHEDKKKDGSVQPQTAAHHTDSNKPASTNTNHQNRHNKRNLLAAKKETTQADSDLISADEEDEDDKEIEYLFGFQVVEEELPLPTMPANRSSKDTSCMKFLKRSRKLTEAFIPAQGAGMLHSDQPRPKQSKK